MINALYKKPSDNYLYRITGIIADYQVLFNPLINKYDVFPADVCRRKKRGLNWHWKFTGTKKACENYILKVH